jgi:hypothetical protein
MLPRPTHRLELHRRYYTRRFMFGAVVRKVKVARMLCMCMQSSLDTVLPRLPSVAPINSVR